MSNDGGLVVRLKNDSLNVSNTFFHGMSEQGRYDFLVHDDIVEIMKYLQDFELLLKRPVTITAEVMVWRDEASELKYRGCVRKAIYDKQFFWRGERETRDRKAITNFCAACIQLDHPHLDFSFCQSIALDEIALDLGEKQSEHTALVQLVAGDEVITLFHGNMIANSQDCSYLQIADIDRFELLRMGSKMNALVHATGPLRLVVKL